MPSEPIEHPGSVPFETDAGGPSGERRRRYNVCVVKIPHADRDVARAVLPDDEAVADRGFVSGIGADTTDQDPMFPAGDPALLDGAHCWYSLMLTDAEAARFAAASNARAVTLDVMHWPV